MQTVLRNLSNHLSGIYPDNEASAIARLLLTKGLGWSPLLVFTSKDSNLSVEDRQKLQDFMERLRRSEPIQYVLGGTEFYDRWFRVGSGVLIPRPETQNLVREILDDWRSVSAVSLLDVGTGSGCIAITLFLELKKPMVEAWDLSSDALSIALQNNKELKAGVCFRKKDLFAEQPGEKELGKYDLIVSNPPYVLERERMDMEDNVLKWEPSSALFVPDDDPLIYYRHLCKIGWHLLKPNGMIYFEINSLFSSEMRDLMEKTGYKEVQIKKDFFGKDRIIKGKK